MLSVSGAGIFITKHQVSPPHPPPPLIPDSGTEVSVLGQITKSEHHVFYLSVSIFLTSDSSQEASQSLDFHPLI